MRASNKLIGAVINNELYGSDEGMDSPNHRSNQDSYDLEDMKLDLGSTAVERPKLDFTKVFTKHYKQEDENLEMNQYLKALGLQADANKLAASGINLNLKEMLA